MWEYISSVTRCKNPAYVWNILHIKLVNLSNPKKKATEVDTMRWSGGFFYRVILDRCFTSQLSSLGASLPHKTTRYDGFRVYWIDRLLLGGSGRKKPLWNGRLMLHRNAANLRNIWGSSDSVKMACSVHVLFCFAFPTTKVSPSFKPAELSV